MLTSITHVKLKDNKVVEVGAMQGKKVIWRTTQRQAIQRMRSGCYLVAVTPETGGDPIMVEIDPGDLYREASLRTVADTAFDRKLLQLPQFPH